MANWVRKIKLNPWWDQAKDGTVSIQILADKIAAKLAALPVFVEDDINFARDELVDQFKSIASDPFAGRDDFDSIMDELYDWGDTSLDGSQWMGRKVCWIDTMSTVGVS